MTMWIDALLCLGYRVEMEVPRAWESMLCFSRGRLVLADCEGLPMPCPVVPPLRTSIATLSLLSLIGSSTSAWQQRRHWVPAAGCALPKPLYESHKGPVRGTCDFEDIRHFGMCDLSMVRQS